MQLAKYIDHTLLKTTAAETDHALLCDQARAHGFKAVCVLPAWVRFCKDRLAGSGVLVATVVSFPWGADPAEGKAAAIAAALREGADELDVVGNYNLVIVGREREALDELRVVRAAAGAKTVKLIIETSELADAQIVAYARMCAEAGIDCVKTSTGTSKAGASPRLVALIKDAVGERA